MRKEQEIELPLQLGIKNVKVVGVEGDSGSLLITLQSTLKFGVCPACGTISQKIKDRHMHGVVDRPIFDKGAKLRVIKRRWRCLNDFCEINTFTEQIEGLPRKHTHTRALYLEAYNLSRGMTYTGVYKYLRNANCRLSLSSIYQKTREILQSNISMPENVETRFVGLDEFSKGKDHDYGVVLVDLERNKIIDVIDGGKTRKAAQEALSRVNAQKLEAVCIDMYRVFRFACNKLLPHVLVVVDCFHVIKTVNEALDRIRKRVRKCLNDKRKAEAFFKYKDLLTTGAERLSIQQRFQLWETFLWNNDLLRTHELKEILRAVYAGKDPIVAKREIERWIEEARSSNIRELQEAAETLLLWKNEILNYWTYRISNGVTEGKINKIKTLRRGAYNFNNFQSLRLKILEQEQN